MSIMKLIGISLFALLLSSCSGSSKKIDISQLKKGDSLFVKPNYDGVFELDAYNRVHSTGYKQKGKYIVDSNNIGEYPCGSSSLDYDYFVDKNTSFVGLYDTVSKYNRNFIILNLPKKTEKYIRSKDRGDAFSDKVKESKKDVRMYKFSGHHVIENFPEEIYFNIDQLTNISPDSIIHAINR